ncbi:DNA-directed RNA polymerase specialized sigma24 family protein [Streptacidiphilus sp. BW17]|uniref:BACON domain-containing protein n=1 Tax=Streptacidiphilus sp. BW17 TaxID=3156274 RepID=UPI003519BD82
MDTVLDQLADALFSYSLSVLCDQDEAVAAVRQTRRLAVRHRRRLRRPELQRAWLYALNRHICLLRLEARTASPAPSAPPPALGAIGASSAPAARSRLARLAWPEAAGTTPAQREALELSGRHQLETPEVAAVLGLRPDAAAVLLAQGTCEVERTAAALAVLTADVCPELSRIGRGRGPVLGRALRGELVRHVDDCPTCRGAAERAVAEGPWPGTPRDAGALPLVHLPRAALRAPRGEEPLPDPRFDRRGFPVHLPPQAERAVAVRHRTVIGSVAAAVVAAPAVALWAMHLADAPGIPAAQVTSVRVADPQSADPSEGSAAPSGSATDPAGSGSGHLGENVAFTVTTPGVTPPGSTVPPGTVPIPVGSPGLGAGQLEVGAAQSGGRTVITLTNAGGSALLWTASTQAPWLRLSRDGGTLAPGAQLTVLVTVDEDQTPRDPWTAQIVFQPSGSTVTLYGTGSSRRGIPSPTPSPTSASPTPPPTPSSSPTPTPAPTPSASASATPSGSTPSGSPSADPTPQPSDTSSSSSAVPTGGR